MRGGSGFAVPLLSSAAMGAIRQVALKLNLLVYPNTHSSYQVPTPRGGGLGIVLVVLLGMRFLFASENLQSDLFW